MLRQLVIVIQRPLNVGLAGLFVAVACAFSHTHGQDGAAGERDKDFEIRKLKEELRKAERQIDQARRAGYLPVEDGFSSAQEIIKSLPEELALNAAKPWDTFQFQKVEEFLQANTVGKPFAANLSVASVKVVPNPAAADNPALPKYEVQLKFADRQFPCNGVVITQQMEDVYPFPFKFFGDDELAAKARRIRIGKSYELRGVIAELTLGSTAGKKLGKDVRIRIVNFEFEPLSK